MTQEKFELTYEQLSWLSAVMNSEVLETWNTDDSSLRYIENESLGIRLVSGENLYQIIKKEER